MAKQQVVHIQERPKSPGDSGIKEYTLDDIAGMPLPVFMRKADKIVNARNQVYHDTVRLEEGAWTNQQSARLFQVGRNKAGFVANTGVTFGNKTDFDTNMIADGEFEGGTTAIVTAIEVDLFLPVRFPTADTVGIITNAAPQAKVANTYSASLLYFALTRQTKLTFYRTETPQENGFLYEFPTRFGASASFGGDVEEGFIQNTTGRGGGVLSFPKVLESSDNFSVLLEPLAASLTLPIDVQIRVLLIAKRIGTVWA